MPVFRYFMTDNPARIALLTPLPDSRIDRGKTIKFSWQGISSARGYKLEVKDGDRVILSALLSAKSNTYTAPPWLKQKTNKVLTWRIQALDLNGSILTESVSQQFQVLGN
jgi:hypothetical protein